MSREVTSLDQSLAIIDCQPSVRDPATAVTVQHPSRPWPTVSDPSKGNHDHRWRDRGGGWHNREFRFCSEVAGLSDRSVGRWSFGGDAIFHIRAGVLLPEVLIAGADQAVLHGSLSLSGVGYHAAASPRPPAQSPRALARLVPGRNARVARDRRPGGWNCAAPVIQLAAYCPHPARLRGSASPGHRAPVDRHRGRDTADRQPPASSRHRDYPARGRRREHLPTQPGLLPSSWHLYLHSSRPQDRGRDSRRGKNLITARAEDDRGRRYLASYDRSAGAPADRDPAAGAEDHTKLT